MRALTLLAEEAEELDGFGVGTVEQLRHLGDKVTIHVDERIA
jgi:hypothetical protein